MVRRSLRTFSAVSPDLRAGRQFAVDRHQPQLAAGLRRQQHPLRLDSANHGRLQVRHDHDRLARQRLRRIPLGNARDDLTLFRPDLELELQELVRLVYKFSYFVS